MRYDEKLLKQKWKSLQCLPLCRRNGGEIGGVVQRTEGVSIHSRKTTSRQFHKAEKSATSPISEPLRRSDLPYPRSMRGRGGHSYVSAAQRLFCEIESRKPSTTNKKRNAPAGAEAFPHNMKRLYRYFTITFFTTSPAFTI